MRHRVGWFIPQQILALTHFASEVTPEEYMEIAKDTQACLQEVDGRFHVIIDNRTIKSEQVVSLEMILQATPQLQSLPLGWVVIVLSHRVQDKTITKETQRAGEIQLKYVETLAEAFATLQTVDASLKWELQVSDFFATADSPVRHA